jgi:hypothetical protein
VQTLDWVALALFAGAVTAMVFGARIGLGHSTREQLFLLLMGGAIALMLTSAALRA